MKGLTDNTVANDPSELGGCSICGRNDGYMDVEGKYGIEHWFVCRRHQAKWRVGVNLFSGILFLLKTQPEDAERLLIENRLRLDTYRTVKPWFPPRDPVCAENLVTTEEERPPYIKPNGEVIIPYNCEPKYRYWQGGQSIAETMEELSSRKNNESNERSEKNHTDQSAQRDH